MKISPVYVHTQAMPIAIEQSEVLRYMGCTSDVSNEIATLAQRAAEQIISTARPKACYRIVPVRISDNGEIDFGVFSVASSALKSHLSGCACAYIFAATLGVEVDRMILRTTHTEPSLALALQAAAAAAIERYCDILCDDIFTEQGQPVGRRFSAGYGDVSLDHQRALLQALDTPRKIGLALTDGCMMTPSKSVTAFVGVGKRCTFSENKCDACDKLNCEFRRGK